MGWGGGGGALTSRRIKTTPGAKYCLLSGEVLTLKHCGVKFMGVGSGTPHFLRKLFYSRKGR